MAISYPIDTPTTIGIESIELRAVNAVATSQSPFTYKQQVVAHPGQRWEASVNIPRVRRDLAAEWKAFLTALRGKQGTFLLGDPDYTAPRGKAKDYTAPAEGKILLENGDSLLLEGGSSLLFEEGAITNLFVDGGYQAGDELSVNGGPANVQGYLLAGDYIQIGSGSGANLHQILVDAGTDSLGKMTLDIWPSLRHSPADATQVGLIDPKGVFRLKSNVSTWSINNSSAYSISFEAIEVIT